MQKLAGGIGSYLSPRTTELVVVDRRKDRMDSRANQAVHGRDPP